MAGQSGEQDFFAEEFLKFSEEAADIMLEAGIIKAKPDLKVLADPKYLD